MDASPAGEGRRASWIQRTEAAFHFDRVWQWVWDRHGPRFSWAAATVSFVAFGPLWVTAALVIAAIEGSDRYLLTTAVAVAIALPTFWALSRPGSAQWRPIERWAAGERIDRRAALESTYRIARDLGRGVWIYLVSGALLGLSSAAIAGADAWRLLQYAVIGAGFLTATQLIAFHQVVESIMRPIRVAIAAGTDAGDDLPRATPTFATWSNIAVLATAWWFAFIGAAVAAATGRIDSMPILLVLIATAAMLVFALPITVGFALAPALRPIRDLAEGTERVAAGDYTQRLPVVQDDDLGALSASFNRMQDGLAERERLRSAFGSYVDPGLANRLLEQGDDVFAGERREVTVMFVDIRDFTPFAEAHPAEDTVAHLNALFQIVVPAVIDAGGHVNKYLGDGALAVFGAPNALDHHGDAAVAAAVRISRLVAERFGGELRIGIGINTGPVIAGTIGGGGKLEFTLIGDTVNVAARIEQLTKTTGDTILLTQHTLDTLLDPPAGLTDRGEHEVKGKTTTIRVHALQPG